MPIELDDIKRDFVSIREAREMSGLRIVLAAFTIPGPWFESVKGIYYVKGLDYVAVANSNEGASDLQIGMGGSQSDLIEWTGQSSAPVVVYNDERPRSLWNDQLILAERLAPEPRLIPEDMDERILMFGLANELMGEQGLVWNKRHLMVDQPLKELEAGSDEHAFWTFLGEKYLYSPEAAALAPARISGIVDRIGAQLTQQKERGSKYLIGDTLSALDIYWSMSCNILHPMPAERCPMFDGFRGPYGNDDPLIAAALTDELKAHRDFIYDEHLELPIVF